MFEFSIYLDSTFASRASRLEEIRKRVGLPEKPKRPIQGYNLFFKEHVNASKGAPVKERAVELGAQWRSLDEATKAKYRQQCEKDIAVYKKQLAEYNSKITKQQKEQLKFELKAMRDQESTKKDRKQKKSLLTELGKPKRSLSALFLFFSEARQKASRKLTAVEITNQWKSLDEGQRKVYADRAIQLQAQYK